MLLLVAATIPTHQSLLSLQLLLSDTESHLQHIQLLFQMRPFQSRSHTGTGIPSSIHDMLSIMMLGVIQQRLDSRLRETPCASIQRLFLSPYDGLSVRVHIEILLELLPWEGVELFNTGDGDGVEVVLFAMFVKGDVSLAST